MIPPGIQTAVVGAVGGMIGAGVVSVTGYLIKDKIEGIEDEVRDLRKEQNKEHKVVVEWLVNLSEALKNEGFDVNRPDEVGVSISSTDEEEEGE